MGLNVVIACHRHKVKTYMMRGEEHLDLQRWMREHGHCFINRQVDIYRDCDDYPGSSHTRVYVDEWEHEDRPAATQTPPVEALRVKEGEKVYEGKDDVDYLRDKVDSLIEKAEETRDGSYIHYAHILEMRACSIEQAQALKDIRRALPRGG